jgi:3-hydroxyisobutyrate dehydrogenase-like beta-hydroxyacid dehydrogenase
VKIARNFLLATVIESLGEAFALVRKSGVDPVTFLDTITRTSFSAPVYRSYGRMMVGKAFTPTTFPLRLGLKDVELALEAGGDTQVPMPLAEVIHEQHLRAIAHGFGEKEWAALGEYIAQGAGLQSL